MSAGTAESSVAPVERLLRRLRRRAGSWYALRAGIAAIGAGSLTFALIATWVGPVVSLPWAVVSWSVVLVATSGAVWAALARTRSLRDTRVASLLQRMDAALASQARSAVELARDPGASALSPELVHAHATRASESVTRVRPADVVSWRLARHPTSIGGVGAALTAAGLLFGLDSTASGAWALLHPDTKDDEGVTLAAVVDSTKAELTYPAYMNRASTTLEDPTGIEAPRGTSIRYVLHPRIEARKAVLEVAGQEVRLERSGERTFEGRFVAREGGSISVRVQRAQGDWLADPTRRWLRTIADQAPRVALTAPDQDKVVELDEPVVIAYDATDDVGLESVELVVRTAADTERRRLLARFDQNAEAKKKTSGTTDVVAAELDARRGDRLKVWVEAKDGDVVSGPNVGKSAKRTLTVESEATKRLEAIRRVDEALHHGLDALADRLEAPVPEGEKPARKRFERANASRNAFVDALESLAEHAAKDAPGTPAEPALYRSMSRRVDRLGRREGNAYGDALAAHAERVKLDDALVDELEDDALELADLLGKARLRDAAEITKELERLRREMASLLAELKRTDSEEARKRLTAALARAEARLEQLRRRLAKMGEDVPSGFLNTDAMPQKKSKSALESMRQAVERGNLQNAEKRLMEFERRITAMAEALGSAEKSFRKSRFGPREKAMAEAMDKLAGLETEQRQLAQRSEDIRRTAAKRALEASGALDEQTMKRLAERAREAKRKLDRIPGEALGPLEEEAFKRARQRLEDSEAALRSGDLGQARQMARKGTADLEDLSRDLELSALMFSGHENEMQRAAKAAKSASRQTRDLQRELDDALPRVGDYVDEKGHERMRSDRERQAEARRAAEDLAKQFSKGPNEKPLSAEAAKRMREIVDRMKRAREALDQTDPLEASKSQEEAARKLRKLRKKLENNRRSKNQSGGGGRGNRGANGRPDHNRRVEIPGADEHKGPMKLRRRVLDAMREDAPSGYEDSVHRYYQELLR